MAMYYRKIDDKSEISTISGSDIILPPEFTNLSSSIIRLCSFIQNYIQQIIFISYGAGLCEAKQKLKNSPNPKARMEFLTSFKYSEEDLTLSKVFNYSRELFHEIYELRNVLTHENWMTSKDFENVVLFSKLDEEAKLSMVKGKFWHEKELTPRDVYNAMIRYIRNVKVISVSDLKRAMDDANLCAWTLKQMSLVLNETDPIKKTEMRKAFYVYKGTSHLFGQDIILTEKVDVASYKTKTIKGLQT